MDTMGNDIEETTAGGIMDTGNEEVKMGPEEDQNPAFVQYQEDNNERYYKEMIQLFILPINGCNDKLLRQKWLSYVIELARKWNISIF